MKRATGGSYKRKASNSNNDDYHPEKSKGTYRSKQSRPIARRSGSEKRQTRGSQRNPYSNAPNNQIMSSKQSSGGRRTSADDRRRRAYHMQLPSRSSQRTNIRKKSTVTTLAQVVQNNNNQQQPSQLGNVVVSKDNEGQGRQLVDEPEKDERHSQGQNRRSGKHNEETDEYDYIGDPSRNPTINNPSNQGQQQLLIQNVENEGILADGYDDYNNNDEQVGDEYMDGQLAYNEHILQRTTGSNNDVPQNKGQQIPQKGDGYIQLDDNVFNYNPDDYPSYDKENPTQADLDEQFLMGEMEGMRNNRDQNGLSYDDYDDYNDDRQLIVHDDEELENDNFLDFNRPQYRDYHSHDGQRRRTYYTNAYEDELTPHERMMLDAHEQLEMEKHVMQQVVYNRPDILVRQEGERIQQALDLGEHLTPEQVRDKLLREATSAKAILEKLATENMIELQTEAMAERQNKGRGFWRYMIYSFDIHKFAMPTKVKDERVKRWVYQLEVAPTTSALHIQGYVELSKQLRKPLFLTLFSPAIVHAIPCVKTKKWNECFDYCTKLISRAPQDLLPETLLVGPFQYGDWTVANNAGKIAWHEMAVKVQAFNSWNEIINCTNEEIQRALASRLNLMKEYWDAKPVNPERPDIVLRRWQRKALRLLRKKPKCRQVFWFWSAEPEAGKTTFNKYIASLDPYNFLPANIDSTKKDLIHAYNGHRIISFNRSYAASAGEAETPKETRAFYDLLELLSDGGLQLSEKYNSKPKIIHAHILVWANIKPKEDLLPKRCIVIEAMTDEQEEDQLKKKVMDVFKELEQSFVQEKSRGNIIVLPRHPSRGRTSSFKVSANYSYSSIDESAEEESEEEIVRFRAGFLDTNSDRYQDNIRIAQLIQKRNKTENDYREIYRIAMNRDPEDDSDIEESDDEPDVIQCCICGKIRSPGNLFAVIECETCLNTFCTQCAPDHFPPRQPTVQHPGSSSLSSSGDGRETEAESPPHKHICTECIEQEQFNDQADKRNNSSQDKEESSVQQSFRIPSVSPHFLPTSRSSTPKQPAFQRSMSLRPEAMKQYRKIKDNLSPTTRNSMQPLVPDGEESEEEALNRKVYLQKMQLRNLPSPEPDSSQSRTSREPSTQPQKKTSKDNNSLDDSITFKSPKPTGKKRLRKVSDSSDKIQLPKKKQKLIKKTKDQQKSGSTPVYRRRSAGSVKDKRAELRRKSQEPQIVVSHSNIITTDLLKSKNSRSQSSSDGPTTSSPPEKASSQETETQKICCNICHKYVTNKIALNNHRYASHPRCPICLERFLNSQMFKEHSDANCQNSQLKRQQETLELEQKQAKLSKHLSDIRLQMMKGAFIDDQAECSDEENDDHTETEDTQDREFTTTHPDDKV